MNECVNEVSQKRVQYKASWFVLRMQLSVSLSSRRHQEGMHQVQPVSLQS